MPVDSRRAFLEALKQADDRLYQAFMEAISSIRGAANLSDLETAIASCDVERVIRSLNLADPAFEDLARGIEEAFRAGAGYQNGAAPQAEAAGLNIAFTGRHYRAEAWMRRHSADYVTEVLEDQRALVREAVSSGHETGRSYRQVALDLIGRTDGNQRKGGLVGLHSQQARFVRNARQQLEDLDPAYFERTRRDKRFDATVKRAIREGKPLSRADIDRITGRYADRLLQTRGKTISLTEANKALNAGRAEAISQMIEGGKIPASAVTKIWDATPGPRTRDSHRALDGAKAKWGEKFESPVTGARLEWPHEEGAPAEEVINCRCSCRFRIDWKEVSRWRG